MVKSELVQKLCNTYPSLLRNDVEKIVDVIFCEIIEALRRGKSIEIRGFGSYKIKTKKARNALNPKNLKIVKIPEKKAIRWKMSKVLFNRLNKNFTEKKISDTY